MLARRDDHDDDDDPPYEGEEIDGVDDEDQDVIDPDEDDAEADEIDEDDTVICPACAAEVWADLDECPSCGHALPKKFNAPPLWIIVGVCAALLGVFFWVVVLRA